MHVVYVIECKLAADADWVFTVEGSPFRSDSGILESLVCQGTFGIGAADVQRVYRAPLLRIPDEVAGSMTDLKNANTGGSRSGTQTYAALQEVLTSCSGLSSTSFEGIRR